MLGYRAFKASRCEALGVESFRPIRRSTPVQLRSYFDVVPLLNVVPFASSILASSLTDSGTSCPDFFMAAI